MSQVYECQLPERRGRTLHLGGHTLSIGHDGLAEAPDDFAAWFEAQPMVWRPVPSADATGEPATVLEPAVTVAQVALQVAEQIAATPTAVEAVPDVMQDTPEPKKRRGRRPKASA